MSSPKRAFTMPSYNDEMNWRRMSPTVRVLSRGFSHSSETDELGYSLSVSMDTSVSS